HEFAVGAVEHILAGLDQALGQRQLIILRAAAIFLDQQRGPLVTHRHHHHRAIALAGADQSLVGALGTIAETQLDLLDIEQAASGDDAGIEDLWLLRHAGSVVPGWFVIMAVHSFKTQTPCWTGIPSIPSCWTWMAPCWICISTTISGSSICPVAMRPGTGSRWNGRSSASIH